MAPAPHNCRVFSGIDRPFAARHLCGNGAKPCPGRPPCEGCPNPWTANRVAASRHNAGHCHTRGRPTAPAAEDFTKMAEDTNAAPRHILYLDDDDTLVFLVRRLLERRGYRVTALTDQQQAIDAVRAQPDGFHLLMTDYNMPGMSGIDVARQVLALNPRLPVAVASGYISDELQAEALAAGVTEVVFKTDAVDAFCEVVARLVNPARPA
ncbi:MAG: hypothetical protein C0443_10490 [Comamonadaceae bacterium]|nr:hypothetical protein [Comamonadaceae bacterium]